MLSTNTSYLRGLLKKIKKYNRILVGMVDWNVIV